MKKILLAAMAGTSLLSLPAAAKDYVKSVEMSFGIDIGTHVRVDGSGQRYSRLSPQTVTFQPTVRALCESGKSVSSWSFLAFSDKQSGSVIQGYDQDWPHVWQSVQSSREMGWTPVKLAVPVEKLFLQHNHQYGTKPGELFVNACNSELDQRVAAGSSRFALLNSGFDAKLPHPFTFRAHCAKGGDASNFTADSVVQLHTLNVRCNPIPQASQQLGKAPVPPPSGPAKLALPFQVSKIDVSASPAQHKGSCPQDIEFEAGISATGGGKLQYRWVDQAGNKSSVRTVEVPDSGKATVRFTHAVGKKSEGPTLGAAPSGKSDIGKLAQGPGAEAGYYSGGYQLQPVSPAGPASKLASYHVQCQTGLKLPATISQ